MTEKPKWERIKIEYEDGSDIVIYRCELERLIETLGIIEDLERAKRFAERVKRLLEG